VTIPVSTLLRDWLERLDRARRDQRDHSNNMPWIARMHTRILAFLISRYADPHAPHADPHATSLTHDAEPAAPYPLSANHADLTDEQRADIQRRNHLLYAPPTPPAPAHMRLRSRSTLASFLHEINVSNDACRGPRDPRREPANRRDLPKPRRESH
jgi:hypothetical protein